jgi:hypothetical protein
VSNSKHIYSFLDDYHAWMKMSLLINRDESVDDSERCEMRSIDLESIR